MKIVFDNIIFGSQKSGGISVVWYELVSRALRDKLDVQFIDFPDNHNIMRERLGNLPNIIRSVPSRYKKYCKYLPVLCRSKEPFIFHSSFFRYCPLSNAINITTVHDFTNELFQTGSGARKERWIKNSAIRHSDYIVCISENTKKDFERFYPSFPKDRIKVIYNGVSDDFFISYTLRWPFDFPKTNYVLFVGERDGYKNFELVVEALKQYQIDIVLTGKPLNDNEITQLKEIKGTYYYVGRVSADKLNILYNNAYALVYPSLYEGFGLPVVEAQKAGCPVIATDASSIPEIIGDKTLLLKTPTPELLIEKLNDLQLGDVRERVVASGLENSKRFSWEKMYFEYCKLYLDVDVP